MRRSKRHATSPFRGVSLSKGTQWVAQYKAAGFFQRFESEMEAFAHYARVYVEFNGMGLKSATMLRRNRAWKGRIPMERLVHHGRDTKGRRYFQFPVDRDTEHVVKVDERDYEKFKDMYWFVKDGRITGVEGFFKVGNKYHFYYEFLDLMIYRAMTGKVLESGKPIKLDGNEFNLTRRNLDSPTKGENLSFDLRKTGLFGPVPDPRQEERDSWEEEESWFASRQSAFRVISSQKRDSWEEEESWLASRQAAFQAISSKKRDSWEEESWLASLGQSYGKTSDQPSWGDEIAMPGERSEPGL